MRQRIRDAGLRATPGRVATFQALVTARAPLRHADVCEVLAPLGLDRATIYRNLIDLTDAGLLARSDLGDHAWRFELSYPDHHDAEHPHFVCVDCGDVSCLPGVALTVTAEEGTPRSVGEKRVEVQLRGLCDQCA